MMKEICDEIGRNGFKKILLFSSHGGNDAFLRNFLRAVKEQNKDYEVFMYYNGLIGPREIMAVIEQRGRDYFPKLTDEDIKTMEDFIAEKKLTITQALARAPWLWVLIPSWCGWIAARQTAVGQPASLPH